MKIEKVNDNQIRCILTAADLADRQLKLSELAYGSDKARRLFHDIMEQAGREFGFDTAGLPLMIEAIPLSQDSIALVLTRVENPEELDTRYSSFAPSLQNDPPSSGSGAASPIDQLLGHMREAMKEVEGKADAPEKEEATESAARGYIFTHRLYSFASMEDLLRAARLTASAFDMPSSLFSADGRPPYFLFLDLGDADTAARLKDLLARISEFGSLEPVSAARIRHMEEHFVCMARSDALQQLARI